MSDLLKVMVSSTVHDLPEYRAQVLDACLRVSMFPKMMEQLPALDADAIEASIALVDEADIYIGLFAHRYGEIPEGHDKSITEMEYERAVERDIPRLIFLISDKADIRIADVDVGDAANKLKDLKSRLKKEHVVSFFENPQDLRGEVLHALTEVNRQLQTAVTEDNQSGKAPSGNFHYVSDIPEEGTPYIAHPYTLLQVKGLVGRKRELEILTDWITKPKFKDTTIFNVVAIGGMGKSALTWTWFNDIAPQEKKWAGQVWWSFYESDATFENFVTRSLAYVSGRSIEALKDMPFADQQNALLRKLDQKSFLLVLDGLERILIAYSRQDAAYLADDTALDEETDNRIAEAVGLPKSAGQSFVGKHQLRKTADVRAGQFLRKLAQIGQSRILISTRLYPADLQVPTGQLYPGCSALFLPGLSDQDALDLWRAYGAKGSREAMLPVFRTFDKHPLLIQLLAYEVANFRKAPGEFDAWQKANPDFDPFGLPLVQVQSEVLAHAMRGLSSSELRTLHVIAGFRMPAAMETVEALLISTVEDGHGDEKPFATLKELDFALTTLEDRGLLGWDRRANRYDLHPIVRGVVWSGLDDALRNNIYGSMRRHFEAMSMVEDYLEVESVDDLKPAIELFNALIGLELYDEAFDIFSRRLQEAMLWRLSAGRLRVELLERLIPDGLEALPRLSTKMSQSLALNSLALGYVLCGQLSTALRPFALAMRFHEQEAEQLNHSVVLCNMSDALRLSGALQRSEVAAKNALSICREIEESFQEGISLDWMGLTLAVRGIYDEAEIALRRSLQINIDHGNIEGEGQLSGYLAQKELWQGNSAFAGQLADQAWELASVRRYERDFIRAARLQGTSALQVGDLDLADKRLHHALARARNVQLREEELPTLVALAELHLLQNSPGKALERLEEVWEPAERGPYPPFHADALNVLAQLEMVEDNTQAAIEAATEAYRKAWCDGPPFAYDAGLRKAKELLSKLNAPDPDMPAFDPSKFEPMPEVEINPDGE